MLKGLIGVFASLLVAVAIIGAIIWNSNSRSYSMVVDANGLSSLIEGQRESYSAQFLSHPNN